jgi:hypothetical protein
MLFVSCDGDEGACYELAGRSCPSGYDLYPTMSHSTDRVLIRCRPREQYWAARGASHWVAAPAPVYPWTAPASAAAPEAPWPNASAATAPEDPWPPPSAGAAPTPAPSASARARKRPGEMDLGY